MKKVVFLLLCPRPQDEGAQAALSESKELARVLSFGRK